MSFSEKVKYVRTELKLSQEDLARELGVSFATINRWENGSYNPSRLAKKAFDDFCKENNMDMDTLIRKGWEVGVFWQDGRPFHDPYAIRINLALPTERVKEAFDRLYENIFR